MGRFIGQLLGLMVGALVGAVVSGSVFCDSIVVAPDLTEQKLLDISPEAAVMILVEGGGLINRCTLGSWSLDLGNFGFMLLALGVPFLFACLGLIVVRRVWKKPT